MRRFGYQRIALTTRVFRRVGDEHHIFLKQGMRAYRTFERHRTNTKPYFDLEELSGCIDQVDDGNRCATDV
ncbi:hypothetical protein [Rhizobium wenxiniae]|uniref:hypothetical protein n=1 Tax=Rhizobium wenxiniae TaxID=1737357 RepID=UPI001C6DE86E|nr:hypothetical protein [Rhizobium wenxiniae]